MKTQEALPNSIGIAECDSYLAQYEACVESHVPSEYQAAAKSGAQKKREAWQRMAESDFKRQALGRICSAAIEAAKTDLSEWGCTWTSSSCGNGSLEHGEECDDGNLVAGDGCSASCFVESGGTGGSTGTGGTSSTGGGTSGGGDACDEATATELSTPGTGITVSTNACVRVRDGYPTWWGARNMKLSNESGAGYPVPFTWSNSCSGNGGTESFTGDWQTQVFGPTDSSCATLIQLEGNGSSTIKLKYYGE